MVCPNLTISHGSGKTIFVQYACLTVIPSNNSLLNTLNKAVQSIILSFLNVFILNNNIIPEQFGFRTKHLTSYELYYVSLSSSQTETNRKRPTTSLFSDLHHAFDCVWDWVLLYKLIKLRVSTHWSGLLIFILLIVFSVSKSKTLPLTSILLTLRFLRALSYVLTSLSYISIVFLPVLIPFLTFNCRLSSLLDDRAILPIEFTI